MAGGNSTSITYIFNPDRNMKMSMTGALIMALTFAFVMGNPVNREVDGTHVDSEGERAVKPIIMIFALLIH